MISPAVGQNDIYLVAPQNYEEQCQRGFIARKDNVPVHLTLPLDWGADPFIDRNWCSKLNHWRMIDPILIEYFKTSDERFLHEALEFVMDWHHYHFVKGRSGAFSWTDTVTGIRALRIAFFLDRLKRGLMQASDDEVATLYELADEHAKRLQDESFIVTSNHGLFQVFGLNLLAKVLPERETCRGGAEFAERMFKRILARQFDEHGVHLEHSPSYHMFASNLIAGFDPLKHFDVPEIRSVLEAASSVEPWLAFPNKRQPHVGDSVGSLNRPKPCGPRQTLPCGREFLVGDFTQSGYAIIRSDTSMIFVTGMAYSQTHKHIDELSFELFEFGRMIFVDSGKYGYKKGAMRHYVVSAAAHNTISLEQEQLKRAELAFNGSCLHGIRQDGDGFTITGEVERPGLFRQVRDIHYNPSRSLIIKDTLKSSSNKSFVSSLHLAPDLEPKLIENGFELNLGANSLRAELLQEDCRIEAVRGQESPLLGWSCTSYLQMTPTTVVRAIGNGRERTFTWRVTFD